MDKKTFELLAKWCAKQHHLALEWQPVTTPQANVKKKVIYLPEALTEEDAFPAIAITMHEAAHIRLSGHIPTGDIVDGPISKEILNACEDARINMRNFAILPNIKWFYEKLYEKQLYNKAKEFRENNPLWRRAMAQEMLRHENFPKLPDGEASEAGSLIRGYFEQIITGIGAQNWELVKNNVQNIMKTFKLEEPPEEGEGGEGHASSRKEGQSEGRSLSEQAHSLNYSPTGHEVAMRESPQTFSFTDVAREQFKQLLNIKEHKIKEEGLKLNTDNLPAFFTGDLEGLFIREVTVKTKKSKIIFCLDASGSMQDDAYGGGTGYDIVANGTTAMIDILDDVIQSEGLNVSYEVVAFDDKPYLLNTAQWREEYLSHSGGTNILRAYEFAADRMKDPLIDGNRLIILITDGCVMEGEIEAVRDDIIRHGGEIKTMILGVNSNFESSFTQKLLNSNDKLLAISKEQMEVALIEGTSIMLEG